MLIGVAHIGRIIAIHPDAFSDKAGHIVERQPTGVLSVAAVDHISERRDAAAVGKAQPDGFFEIDRRHQFPLAQIGDGRGAVLSCDAKSDALTGAPPVQSEHQSRSFGRAAVHVRKNAQRPMISMHPGQGAIDIIKPRLPDQRPVAEHP